MDKRDFWALRDAPLHSFEDADWATYYSAMSPWLEHADADIRGYAIERLCMAVFRAERGFDSDAASLARSRERAAWLLHTLEAAHARHNDVIPHLLKNLRWHGAYDPFPEILVPWLAALRQRHLPGVSDAHAEGAIVLIGDVASEDDIEVRLDHPSPYVRSCLAYRLGVDGFCGEEAFDKPFIDRLTTIELARPGVAGPFWSGWSVMNFASLPFDPVEWMLDIVERRDGPEPDDTAFNGIDFHVHELAARSVAGIGRLFAAGQKAVAIEAATEIRAPVAGMDVVLRRFGCDADVYIAGAAQMHLARYYNELHPSADAKVLRCLPRWQPEADAFVFRQGNIESWRDVAVFYPAGRRRTFDDVTADAILDLALPPALRGDVARHPLVSDESGPEPYRSRDSEQQAYASGALVTREGQLGRRRWKRLEIIGRGLQDIWRPFDWT